MPAPKLLAWRLEMPQKPGCRYKWLGPYTSHWLTPEAEEVVRFMEVEHTATLPHPAHSELFAVHRSEQNPLLCGCASEAALIGWFGRYLRPLQAQGGHIAVYAVPRDAVLVDDPAQLVFVQSQAGLVSREGEPPPGELVRSSAGRRAQIIAASAGRYDFRR